MTNHGWGIALAARHFRAASLTAALLLPGTALASGVVAINSDALVPHEGATAIGRTDPARKITISLALPSRDPKGAAEFVVRVTNPKDPLFRHYLTPTEYAARFGASQADYAALVAWARAHNLAPGEAFTGRHALPLTGTVSDVETATGVIFRDYVGKDGKKFYVADSSPTLPAELATKVTSLIGLHNRATYATQYKLLPKGVAPHAIGNGPNGALNAADLRTLYATPGPVTGAKPQTVAIFEQGGFAQADVATYQQTNGLPAIPVADRNVDGYGGGIDDPGVELEAVLDIDMVGALNPGVKKIVVYEDGSVPFQVALVDSFNAIAKDNTAQTVSVSYGLDEAQQGSGTIAAENTALTQLAAQGQTVFVSAGDGGAFGREGPPGLFAPDPGSQPLVTSVGGTTIIPGQGESYLLEQAWNELLVGAGGTGGGVSSVWPIPTWQTGIGINSNGGSTTNRNVPDVAAVGDPVTGVAVYSALNGGWITLGGTSVSAPIWAGFFSIANGASQGFGFGRIGFANPAIYNIGVGFNNLFGPDFHDVIEGSNGAVINGTFAGYFAGYGYDNTTGWGSFEGANLAAELVATATQVSGTAPPAPNGVHATATSTSITVGWTKSPGAAYYDVLAISPFGSIVGNVLSSSTHATITGLTPSTYYELVVLALAKGGYNDSFDYVSTTAQ